MPLLRTSLIMLWRLLLLVSLLASLAGAAVARPVEVTLFEGGEGMDFYQRVGEQFTQLGEGRSLQLEGDPAMADRLRIRVLEGRFPEVTNASPDVWNLITHDQIQPLDAWLDAPSWDGKSTWRETFVPGSLDQFSRDGKTYGVPLVYVIWSVYYDKALFRREGWSPPRTWPELFALGEKMKARGLAPMAFQGRYSFYAEALVKHTYYQLAGQQAYEQQQKSLPGSYDNAFMTQALSLVARLAREDFQKGALGMSHTEAQLEFFQGRAGMLMCGSWLFSEMRDNIPPDFELGAFPLPLPESDNADARACYATSSYWFIFKNSSNPDGGVDFLRYLTSAQVARAFAMERGITVAVGGANSKLHPMMVDVAKQLDAIERTFGTSSGQVVPGLDQVWSDNLSDLLAGRIQASEASKRMEEGARSAVAQQRQPNTVTVVHPGKTSLFLGFLILGAALAVRRGSERATWRKRYRKADVLLFLAPPLLLYLLFFVLPSSVALLGSLVRWDGIGQPEFVGTLNFQRLLLESDVFWSALGNNLFLMTVIPALVLPLSLALANALHHGVWGSRWFRIAFFFPNLLGVAGILLWQQLYNPQAGPINKTLVGLGLTGFEAFPWLAPEHLYTALIPMSLWGACGFNMVLFLAAMQSVPNDLYEAADIFGANGWQKFRFITLPMIRSTVVAALLFMMIGAMKAFEAIWLLTNQAPTSQTHVVGTLMIRSMFVEQKIGQAAAIACLLFVTVLVGSLLADRWLGRDEFSD